MKRILTTVLSLFLIFLTGCKYPISNEKEKSAGEQYIQNIETKIEQCRKLISNSPNSTDDDIMILNALSDKFEVMKNKYRQADPENRDGSYKNIVLMDHVFDEFIILIKEISQNQRVDLTVKTPVESGKAQGTAGHP
jgi:hypothetical protein